MQSSEINILKNMFSIILIIGTGYIITQFIIKFVISFGPVIETNQSITYITDEKARIIVDPIKHSMIFDTGQNRLLQVFNIPAVLEKEELISDLSDLSVLVVFIVVLAFFTIILAITLFILSNINTNNKSTNYKSVCYILRIAKIYGKVNGTIWMLIGLVSLAFGCYFSYHLSDLINHLK